MFCYHSDKLWNVEISVFFFCFAARIYTDFTDDSDRGTSRMWNVSSMKCQQQVRLSTDFAGLIMFVFVLLVLLFQLLDFLLCALAHDWFWISVNVRIYIEISLQAKSRIVL